MHNNEIHTYPTSLRPILILLTHLNPLSADPSGLRRGSAAARLLGLRVLILPGAWMSVVSVVCVVR